MHREFEAEFILARPDNPKIPTESVDLIFVCNTYHHLEDRTAYFGNIKSSLRTGGRIAIIDFYHDDRSVELGFPKHHLIAREQVVEEMTGAANLLRKEHTFLPKQYFLNFPSKVPNSEDCASLLWRFRVLRTAVDISTILDVFSHSCCDQSSLMKRPPCYSMHCRMPRVWNYWNASKRASSVCAS